MTLLSGSLWHALGSMGVLLAAASGGCVDPSAKSEPTPTNTNSPVTSSKRAPAAVNDTTTGAATQCHQEPPEGSVLDGAVWDDIVPDARVDPGSDCEQKRTAFDAFVLAHRACSVDQDCTVIGDCDPNADFRAVQVSASAEAWRLMQERCYSASDGPTFDAVCTAGVCTLKMQTDTCCGCVPPDAGVHGDAAI